MCVSFVNLGQIKTLKNRSLCVYSVMHMPPYREQGHRTKRSKKVEGTLSLKSSQGKKRFCSNECNLVSFVSLRMGSVKTVGFFGHCFAPRA